MLLVLSRSLIRLTCLLEIFEDLLVNLTFIGSSFGHLGKDAIASSPTNLLKINLIDSLVLSATLP
jgi:hypothetical protein